MIPTCSIKKVTCEMLSAPERSYFFIHSFKEIDPSDIALNWIKMY